MRFIGALLAIGLLAGSVASAAETESLIGRKVSGFELQDFRGQPHRLADLGDSQLVVVAFLGTECPLAKLYSPRLREFAEQYGPRGVAFLGINANRQDSVTELAAYARVHEIDFPILKDLNGEVVEQFGATRTPQVFVLDRERVIRYHGRIDDQFGFDEGVGYQKPKADRNDLAEALDELLAGHDVSVPVTAAKGCLIGRVRDADDDSDVTYSKQIARILQNRCVECHRNGQIAPFALTSYDEVAGWGEMIQEVVREQRMPPWHANAEFGHFANDARMPDEEKELIYRWVEAGCPEGDASDLPEPREFVEGWMMPQEPDTIVYIRDEPVTVPAEGVVDYQYYQVDPGFTEDKWVKWAECMPDNRRVVHHIICFVQPPREKGRSRNRDVRGFHFLTGFAPGTRPMEYPAGMAKKIPAGSKLIFQMHYTPCGSEQVDRSKVGLVFCDESEVTHLVATTSAATHNFEIPPFADNHKVESSRTFDKDVTLISLFPHMHLRGKSFRYELTYPDGTSEIILDVPRYDFNWQNHFILAEPKHVPKGTRMHCTAYFDNSEDNLANPDPSETVRWGDQTWEEMMIGWFDMAIPVESAEALIEGAKDGESGD